MEGGEGMARRVTRSVVARPAKKIDNVIWELSTGSSLAQNAGVAAIQFSTVGTTPSTLLRIRGEFMGFVDGALATAKLIALNWGIILVPEGSATTAQFDPVADANAPWLAYGAFHLGYEEPVVDVVDIPGITSYRQVVDNKAMRRIRPDVEMQLCVTNSTVSGAIPMNSVYSMRWLQGF